MDLIVELRQDARDEKNWSVSDKIRDGLAKHNITIKDGKEGTTWNVS
jgi:cysteinyl-tRNA synthetase